VADQKYVQTKISLQSYLNIIDMCAELEN